MGNLLQSVKQNPVLWIWNLLSYDNFLVYAMTFFRETHVQGSRFHLKNVNSLLTDTMLYSPRLYKAALQRAGFFVPFWSVNWCKFPPL